MENFIKENRKINTYERYKEIYKNNINPYIDKYYLKDLNPLFIEKLLQSEKKRGLSNSTLQSVYGVINSSLNRAVRLQIINENMCKFVERPKREKFVAETLTIDEFNMILNELDKNNYGDYMFSLALTTTLELGD